MEGNHYQTLGLEINATDQMIKKAYHTLARMYHPDKTHNSDIEKFSNIKNAYEILSDPDKKHDYDIFLSGSENTINPFEPNDTNIKNILDEFFQNSFRKPPDTIINVKVTAIDIDNNKTKRITFNRIRTNIYGKYVKSKFTIKIRVGNKSTMIPEEGDEVFGYTIPADLLINFVVKNEF